MATLNAFGFSVQKARKQEEPVKLNAQHNAVTSPILPWSPPSKPSLQPFTPAQNANESKFAAKKNNKKPAVNLKKQHTITRYLSSPSSSSPQSTTATTEQESRVCVLRRNIPLATIWPQIVQEYSLDARAVEEQPSNNTVLCRRGRRRRHGSSDEEMEESESKTIKVDGELLRAFQRLATGSTVPFHFTGIRLPPREQDQNYDSEDMTRQVRKRMTVEESQEYIQNIISEYLMV